jgi:hypothetical protein
MGHTKKLISDSVLYKLAGGVPTPSFPVHERDVWASLDNKINALFKLKHFDTTLPLGETIPESSMIATYENVAVTSLSGGRSQAILPINPISLPKNMGVYLIYDAANPNAVFIPLQQGQVSLLNADELLNDLMGQIGYSPKKDKVIFTKDITLLGITSVTMELCVLDISDYTTTEALPIPADYIDILEGQLVAEFAPVLAKTGYVSNFTNQTQQPIKP